MRKRSSVNFRFYVILNLTMVFMYVVSAVILFFWNVPSLPPATRKMFSGVLILYAIYRGFVLIKKLKRPSDGV